MKPATILMMAIILMIVPSQVFSKTIVVTTSNDSIAGSLRDAINKAASGDEITFDKSLTEIKLGEQINIDKTITISGNPNLLIHDRSGSVGHRLFEINGAESIVLNIKNLKFSKSHERVIDPVQYDTNGKIILIRNTNSTVNINSCYFVKDNSSYGGFLHYYTDRFYGQHGGGIAQYGGTLNISNTTFSQLEASGEIYSGNGGAIFQLSGELSLVNCTFYANSAGICNNSNILGIGAAIYSQDSNVSVTNCTFCEQQTYYSYTEIGPPLSIHTSKTQAITLSNASLTTKNSIFYSNGGRDIGGTSSTFYTGGYNIFESTTSSGTGDLTNFNPGFVLNNGRVVLSNSTFWIPVCALDAVGPAVDALLFNGNGAPQFDQRGHSRINSPDIGASEFEGCMLSEMKATWNPSPIGQDSWVYDMSVVNDSVVWVKDANADTISITSNGGASWTSKPLPLPAGFPRAAGGICALSKTKAYYILSLSDSKGIYQTTDGGDTWTKQSTGFNQNSSFPDVIHFWNENEGVAIGDADPNSNFEIYNTLNGGIQWNRVPDGNMPNGNKEATLNSQETFRVIGNSIFFLTNKARIFKSPDKGITWSVINTPFHNASDSVITFDFKDNNNGLISYCSADRSVYKMYRTTDGGQTWNSLSTSNFNQRLKYISSANAYFSMNINGGLSYSCDDGQTWTSVSYFNSVKLRTASFSPSGKMFWGGLGNVYFSLQILSVSTHALTIAYSTNSTKTFDIVSNTDWTITSDQPWLEVGFVRGSGNRTVLLTTQANPETDIRTATVTISGTGVANQKVIVTQEALPVGLAEKKISAITIYPNPASNLLFFEGITPNANIAIYNISGKKVFDKRIENNQIDISKLAKGMYTISVIENSGITTKKFVKQ